MFDKLYMISVIAVHTRHAAGLHVFSHDLFVMIRLPFVQECKQCPVIILTINMYLATYRDL